VSAPWLDRLPTAEEVEAHAAAHGVEYDGRRLGLWAFCRPGTDKPPVIGAALHGPGSALFLWVWSIPLGRWFATAVADGDRLCPLTAEGLPVALVTEVERLRAELDAERAVSASLRAELDAERAVSASLREQLARLLEAVNAIRRPMPPAPPLGNTVGDFPMGPGWGVYRSGAGGDE
jgi:hypothetical protein